MAAWVRVPSAIAAISRRWSKTMQIERKTPEQAAAQDAVLDYVWTMLQQLIAMMSAAGLGDQAKRLGDYEL